MTTESDYAAAARVASALGHHAGGRDWWDCIHAVLQGMHDQRDGIPIDPDSFDVV